MALVELRLATTAMAPPMSTTAMAPMTMARYFSKNDGSALTRPLEAALRRAAERDVAVEVDVVVGGRGVGAPAGGVAGVGAAPVSGLDVAAGAPAPVEDPPVVVVGGWKVRDFLLTGLLVKGSESRLDEPRPGGAPAKPPDEDDRQGERDDRAGQPGR